MCFPNTHCSVLFETSDETKVTRRGKKKKKALNRTQYPNKQLERKPRAGNPHSRVTLFQVSCKHSSHR